MALLDSDRYRGGARPPLGARLRTGHPLAYRLRHMFVFNERNGRYVTDLCGNLVPTLAGTQAPVWQPDGLHWAGTWSNATTVEQIQLPAQMGTAITNPFTIEAWVKIPGSTTGSIVHLANSDVNTNGSAQGVGLGIGNTSQDNSGTTLIALNEQVAFHSSGIAVPTNIGRGLTQIGLVYQPNPGTSVFYIGGRRVATASFAALAAGTGAALTLFIGGYFPQGKAAGRVLGDGTIGLVRQWDRALGDQDFAELSVNPYAMMQPSQRLLSRAVTDSGAPAPPAWHTSLVKVWK